MTTSTSASTNNDLGFINSSNGNNCNSYPPHGQSTYPRTNNNNNVTPGHTIHDRPHHGGVSSLTISGGTGSNAFVHLTDGCRTLTLPRRSNASAAAQSKSWMLTCCTKLTPIEGL